MNCNSAGHLLPEPPLPGHVSLRKEVRRPQNRRGACGKGGYQLNTSNVTNALSTKEDLLHSQAHRVDLYHVLNNQLEQNQGQHKIYHVPFFMADMFTHLVPFGIVSVLL